jgi:hypothetical protein
MDPIIWGPVFTALAGVVAFGIKLYWVKRDETAKKEPAQRDQEIDYAFSEGTPEDRARELQSLDDRLRRAEVDAGLARLDPSHPERVRVHDRPGT